jgi:YHS domain-containing protein
VRRVEARLTASLGLSLAIVGCSRSTPRGFEEPPADGTKITDPVSGASCEKTPETPAAIVRDRSYYFCAPESAARFVERPETYADPSKTP